VTGPSAGAVAGLVGPVAVAEEAVAAAGAGPAAAAEEAVAAAGAVVEALASCRHQRRRHQCLYRKAAGREAKLCYMGHATMENRHGLAVAGTVTFATGTAERRASEIMLKAKAKKAGRRTWRASRYPSRRRARASHRARDPALLGCRAEQEGPGHSSQDRGHGTALQIRDRALLLIGFAELLPSRPTG
jgi:hypothetical protein